MALYTCKNCKVDNLLADEMTRTSSHPGWCKKCYNNAQRERHKNFKKTEKGVEQAKKNVISQRWYKYGLTTEEYNQMLKQQLNGCAICKKEFSDIVKPVVDHHHGLKKVRGILCHPCNLALAYLQEDEDIIWNMLEYLKRTTWSKNVGEANVNAQQ